MKLKILLFSLFLGTLGNIYSQINYQTIKSNEIQSIKVNHVVIFKDSLQNYPLFFPEASDVSKHNLIEIIMNSVEENNTALYRQYYNDCFVSKTDLDHAKYYLGESIDSIFTLNDNDELDTIVVKNLYDPSEIIAYIFQEVNLYDHSNNLIDKRIVAICPIRKFYRQDDVYKNNPKFTKVFWVLFKDIKAELEKNKIYNLNSDNIGTMNDFLMKNNYNSLNYHQTKFNTYFYDSIQPIIYANEKDFNVISTIPGVEYVNTNTNPVITIDTNINLGSDFYPFHRVNFKSNFQFGNPKVYPPIKDEIVCAKIVYKHVLKTDSVNRALFEPTTTKIWTDRPDSLIAPYGYLSLFDFTIDAIEKKGLKAYRAPVFEIGLELDEQLDLKDIYSNIGKKIEMLVIASTDNYYDTAYMNTDYNSNEIYSYIFQEVELYNSKGEVVQTQTLAFCPVRKFYGEYDYDQENKMFMKVFWINYSEFQPYAANQNVLKTSQTNSETFDDFIFNRKYFGYEMSTKQAQIPPYNTDDYFHYIKDEQQKNYAHNYFNLYSDNKIALSLKNELNLPEIQNTDYNVINKKDFKSAKIVFTEINSIDDTILFLNNRNLGYLSLIELFVQQIKNGNANCYKTSKLKKSLTIDKSTTKLGKRTIVVDIYDFYGNPDTVCVSEPISPDEFYSYKLKELWIYDASGNVIEKRIIAICPIRKYYNDDDYDMQNPIIEETVWFSFSEIQHILKENMLPQYNFGLPNTYNNYFVENKYNFIILEELKINKRKANKILKQFKN